METARKPGIVLADDHKMFADGIAQLLAPKYRLLDRVNDGDSLVRSAIAHRPDVILSDIAMPTLSGIEAMIRIHRAGIESSVIFMTVHDEPAMVREAISSGARGYVLKASAGEELFKAIDEATDGRIYVSPELSPVATGQVVVPVLTNRQKNILDLLSTGLRSKQIAYELGMSVRTVDTHRYAIMKAFGVCNSISLIREAERLGIVKR